MAAGIAWVERVSVLVASSGWMAIFGPRSLSSSSTLPGCTASVATPFGSRASKISTTRGRPAVTSAPATPPEWNVRTVSCVPGSPLDCAAMMPTASPISHVEPVARNVP